MNGVAAQFAEISGEMEMIGWSGSDTNGQANAKSKTISFVCIVGTNEWRIENDFPEYAEEKWLFDGTNVYNSVRVTRPAPEKTRQRLAETTRLVTVPSEEARSNLTIRIWSSRDGHPLADYGVNIPWLAFCSGTHLKRENRLIPLPVAILRHTRDRFAYTGSHDDLQGRFWAAANRGSLYVQSPARSFATILSRGPVAELRCG